MLFVGF